MRRRTGRGWFELSRASSCGLAKRIEGNHAMALVAVSLCVLVVAPGCGKDEDNGGVQPNTAPHLVLSTTSLDLGSESSTESFTIANGGTGTLTWTVSDNQSWLSVSPTNGVTTTEQDEVTVTVSRSGLAAGAYSGAVTVTPGTGADQGVAISMTVSGSGPVPGEMVLIPAGSFTMGSPPDEPERWDNETQHEVTLTRSFYLQSTEVTNQQYADMAQWAHGDEFEAAGRPGRIDAGAAGYGRFQL